MTNNKHKEDAEKYSYCFPKGVASTMGKISMRSQMEASMLSQFLLLIGMTIMIVYMLITKQSSVLYKIIITFNLLCGFLLIGSYLVTTYNQYTSFMGSMGYDPKQEKEMVRKRGNLFKRIKLARKEAKERKVRIKDNETPEEHISAIDSNLIELEGGSTE